MDGPGVRRALRQTSLAVVVGVVLLICGMVAAAALLSPGFDSFGGNADGACSGVQTPTVVVDEWAATGSEGSLASPSMSWLPYGTRCTWTLSDGSTVWKDASWDITLTVLGASTVALGAVGVLAWSGRRSSASAST
ncbi:hypothetical protein [Sanguibacter sp. 25GB23B1]|uniref:hypothetical protein n=1 Tax=unclassified Sanguibacter TaxID=2645534 RepID=UPI0032AF2AB4